MNLDNITKLGNQLKQIGFSDLEILLLQRICFRPNCFQLLQSIDRGGDSLAFTFQFERDETSDDYVLLFYDVTLHKELKLSTNKIGSVDLAALEAMMSGINWKNVFKVEQLSWSPSDKVSWETALTIEQICEQLAELGSTEEGRVPANRMKMKYWSGYLPEDITGNLTAVRSKSTISQRFYYSQESSITVDEAYRFLQNRWIEKQLQQKEKIAKQPEQPLVKQSNEKKSKKQKAVQHPSAEPLSE